MSKINSLGKLSWQVSIIYVSTLFVVGLVWAMSSPVSSAADDDFHLTSIWCQKTQEYFCERVGDKYVLVPADLNTGEIPEKFTGVPPCYVVWPYSDKSAECVSDVRSGKAYSDRLNISSNSKIYYKIVSQLVSKNTENSVLRIRVGNVLIFCVLMFMLIQISSSKVSQKTILAVGLGIVPVGIFFIASTNPISWSIISVITHPIFLFRISHDFIAKQKFSKLALIGYILSAIIGIASRYDSLFYLSISSLAAFIVILQSKFDKVKISNRKYLSRFLNFIVSILLFLGVKTILELYHGVKIEILPKVINESNPNPIVNILIELPAFVFGIMGGQEPRFYQSRGTLGRDFTFGVGWLEFNFLSITGIFIGTAVMTIIFSHLQHSSFSKQIVVNLFLTTFISLIIIERAIWDYSDGAYFQPRYFVGFLISFLTIFFISERSTKELSIPQRNFAYVLLVVGAIMAWRLVMVRYSSGLEFPVTNFTSPIKWASNLISPQLLIGLGVTSHAVFYYLTFFIQKNSVESAGRITA